jgi:predicted metal-dependent HD superfamily phosphohydrolase
VPALQQWRDLWKAIGRPAPNAVFERLMARYAEPHRQYHTIRHLGECLAKRAEIEATAVQPREVELALWFHDAIYEPQRHDNEQRSADWARSTVLDAGLTAAMGDRVHALVMVTQHDAVPIDTDQRVIVDVDLSILGADADRFDEYERQVRAEYAWVPDFLFRIERRKILAGFLARRCIFNTDQFYRKYEASARANLRRSITQLDG